jgi:hypothetical protein
MWPDDSADVDPQHLGKSNGNAAPRFSRLNGQAALFAR